MTCLDEVGPCLAVRLVKAMLWMAKQLLDLSKMVRLLGLQQVRKSPECCRDRVCLRHHGHSACSINLQDSECRTDMRGCTGVILSSIPDTGRGWRL